MIFRLAAATLARSSNAYQLVTIARPFQPGKAAGEWPATRVSNGAPPGAVGYSRTARRCAPPSRRPYIGGLATLCGEAAIFRWMREDV